MYCLSWNSYKNNICNGFAQLQQKEEFVDMTIVAEGHLVKVHKNLISLASPYIKNVIKSVPCKHPIIFLTNITHDILCQLLEYIYTGEVHVEIDKLNDFVKAAKELQLPSITNDLLHEAKSEEKSINAHNAQKTLEEYIEEKRQKLQNIGQNNMENWRLDSATSDAANTTRANDNIVLDIDMELLQNVNNHILPQATSLINGQSTNNNETIPVVNNIQLEESRLQDDGASKVAIDPNKKINVLDTKIILSSQNNHHIDYSNSIIVTEVDNANNFDEFLKFPDPHNSAATIREHSMPDRQIQELESMDNTKKVQIDLSLDGGTYSLLQQYTVSNRGSLQMVLNRYVYNMHYSAYGGVKRRWRCIDYRFLRCGAFVDTHNDEIVKRKNCHTHPFHDNKIMQKIKANLIFGALNTAINESKKYNYMEDSVNISDSDG